MAVEETKTVMGMKYTLIARAYTNKRPDEFGISMIVTKESQERTGIGVDYWIEQLVRACDKYAAENGALGWDGDLTEEVVYADQTLAHMRTIKTFHRHMVWQDWARGNGR